MIESLLAGGSEGRGRERVGNGGEEVRSGDKVLWFLNDRPIETVGRGVINVWVEQCEES